MTFLRPFTLFLAALSGLLAAEPATLRFCIRAEPRTLDPLLVDDASSETVRYLTGGFLVRINRATQALTPGLAASWKVSEAGKRIDFELRRNIAFSDGTPFIPDDVAYTIRRMMDPATNSPVGDPFRTGTAQPGIPQVEARATGPASVMLRFPSAIANLPALFDQIAIQSSRSKQKDTAVLGPFLLADRKAGLFLNLRRNSRYWERDAQGRPLPYLDAIHLDIQQNRDIEALQFERGEIDLIQNLDPDLYDRLSKSGAAANGFFDAGPSLDSEQLWFNLTQAAAIPAYKKEWFADVQFRRAVSAAIRRDDICRLVYHGHAVPALGPVSRSNRAWYNTNLPARPTSIDAAQRDLAAAGFHKQGDALRDRHGNAVEFSLITNAGSKVHERMLTLIQQDVARLGIKVNLVTLDFASLIERITRTFAYESCLMFLTNVAIDPNEQMNVWLSSAANHQWNPSQTKPATPWEAEIDKLMQAQTASPDPRRRKEYFDRVQQIVREQEPFIYLVNPNALVAVSKRVHGSQPGLLRPQAYWNAERLSFETTLLPTLSRSR